ncbi:MAG: hypothetical protein LBN12_04840 [Clostridiales Family XIII bacterium]|jgi:hypothetical protein|nr:hypothetical protein [Clostridiales Family XIII bacterium]
MSFEDVIRKAAGIGADAENLSRQIAGASQSLGTQAQGIAAIGKGNRTAEQAAQQAQTAARSLADSATALSALKRAADDFVKDAS